MESPIPVRSIPVAGGKTMRVDDVVEHDDPIPHDDGSVG